MRVAKFEIFGQRWLWVPLIFGVVALANGMTSIMAQNSPSSGWVRQTSTTTASLRGLSVVSSTVVWASGANGTVLRTIDGGATWLSVGPPENADLDFRCLHAFDAQNAVVASSGDRDLILRTNDGGSSWRSVYEHPRNAAGEDEAFFDAVRFWDDKHGLLMGDPIDGFVMILITSDAGNSWTRLPAQPDLMTRAGEAGFAASGTHVCLWGDQGVLIGLGGGTANGLAENSRVMRSDNRGRTWHAVEVPMQRNESSGIFSIVSTGPDRMIAVGGDYRQESLAEEQISLSIDGGRTWFLPTGSPPKGFRSVVCATQHDGQNIAVAFGPSGGDVSFNQGEDWQLLSETGYHVAAFAPDGTVLFVAGSDGRIAKVLTGDLLDQVVIQEF